MSLVLATEKHLVFSTIQKVGKWSEISNIHSTFSSLFCNISVNVVQ